MKLEKSKQSILGFILELLGLLISNTQASFLEQGMAFASLVRLGIYLSESLSKEAGNYRSIDMGKDWWILKDHPHIFAVRLDDEVWQVKEGGTTFTYMQNAGKSETLNIHIEVDDEVSGDDEATIRTHIVHLKLTYPNEGQPDYLWQLHQFTTEHKVHSSNKKLLAESKEERTFSAEHASFIIFNSEKPLFSSVT